MEKLIRQNLKVLKLCTPLFIWFFWREMGSIKIRASGWSLCRDFDEPIRMTCLPSKIIQWFWWAPSKYTQFIFDQEIHQNATYFVKIYFRNLCSQCFRHNSFLLSAKISVTLFKGPTFRQNWTFILWSRFFPFHPLPSKFTSQSMFTVFDGLGKQYKSCFFRFHLLPLHYLHLPSLSFPSIPFHPV